MGCIWNEWLNFRPRPGDPPRIERDDFPAPPYPYTDPERRRRWSESSKRISQSESDAEDNKNDQSSDAVDAQSTFTTDDSKVKVNKSISTLDSTLAIR